jgi:hypothetical protein
MYWNQDNARDRATNQDTIIIGGPMEDYYTCGVRPCKYQDSCHHLKCHKHNGGCGLVKAINPLLDKDGCPECRKATDEEKAVDLL